MQSVSRYPKNLHETLSLTHFQSILLITGGRHEILPFYLITTYLKFHIPSKRLSKTSIMCCWFITLELWMRTIDGFELKSHWIEMRALDTYMLSHAMIFVACSGENCCGKRSLRGPNYYSDSAHSYLLLKNEMSSYSSCEWRAEWRASMIKIVLANLNTGSGTRK